MYSNHFKQKEMKSIIIFLFAFSTLMFASCNKEEIIEYSNKPTEIQLATPVIQSTPGQTITIQAKLIDDLGVKYYTVVSSSLSLNKIVNISTSSSIVNSFDLSYAHKIPANASGKEHEILLRVKNLTGQISEATVKVTLN
jgi:hypothetical protein